MRLLPPRRGLASAPGDCVPRPGVAALSLLGVPDRGHSIRAGVTSTQGIHALGVADRTSVRGRGLDCSATHADARRHVCGGINMRPLAGSVIFGWLFLGTWCAPACGDGGTVRMSEKRGGFLITVFTAP